MSGIAVFNKAISTLQDSQKNLQAISLARQKMERDEEMFKIKKQEADIKAIQDAKNAKERDSK